ncbi:hypothetical protein LX32DRAFT_199528 [Colletotrichum zoysiae]|uniref:Uncharacterized protein n=1 Tax=Colletotrichum zoysiae TaxID=1216348 RepID=A0AAD9M335_9PEZI|nr:hypothetical protein LX32DRAFT_199528 [Colletotrichum zoysiae]
MIDSFDLDAGRWTLCYNIRVLLCAAGSEQNLQNSLAPLFIFVKRRCWPREVENISRVDRAPPLNHLDAEGPPGDNGGKSVSRYQNNEKSVCWSRTDSKPLPGNTGCRGRPFPPSCEGSSPGAKFHLYQRRAETAPIIVMTKNKEEDWPRCAPCWYLLHGSPARRHRRIGHCATALLDKIAVSCYCPGSGRGAPSRLRQ